MRRRVLLAAFCALPLLAHADEADGPAKAIAALNDALLAVMHAGKDKSFADRAATLRPVVEKVFDLPLLARSSVGKSRWESLPDTEKSTLLDLFSQFTVASYVANFDAFNGEQFVIDADVRKVESGMLVPSRIVAPNGDVTKLDYVLREGETGWQVVDILLDGSISRVAVSRSDFRSLLAPGDASKLIDSLRSKIANLTAGKPA